MSEPVALPEEVTALVEQKKIDELETLWTSRMESQGADLGFFFALASAVKKRVSGGKAVAWLKFLADCQREMGNLEAQTRVLLEVARMSPSDGEIRGALAAALKARFGTHPSWAAVSQQFPIEKSREPTETASRIERWMRYRAGDVYLLAGRGAGRIVELNPTLDVIRVEIAGTKVPLSLVSAERNLVALPEGHFLREKVENPAALKALSDEKAAEALRRLLHSFGRAMSVAEVKEHFAGVVDEARWSAFWAARCSTTSAS